MTSRNLGTSDLEMSLELLNVRFDSLIGSSVESDISRCLICEFVRHNGKLYSQGLFKCGYNLILVSWDSTNVEHLVNSALVYLNYDQIEIETSFKHTLIESLVLLADEEVEIHEEWDSNTMIPIPKKRFKPNKEKSTFKKPSPKKANVSKLKEQEVSSPRSLQINQIAFTPTPGVPDWVTRRNDVGAVAELFVYHYIMESYSKDKNHSLDLSIWVSSCKRRFYPDDTTRVNDALGADFEFIDTLGIFAKTKGNLVRLEVKGSCRSEITQFELSRNEIKGFERTIGEFMIVLIANVCSDGMKPYIYAVIRDLNQIPDLTPIQFLASFNINLMNSNPRRPPFTRSELPTEPAVAPIDLRTEPDLPTHTVDDPLFFEDAVGTAEKKRHIIFSDSDDDGERRSQQTAGTKRPLLTDSSWYK
jgi:Domain of unknown function (DUF3883)